MIILKKYLYNWVLGEDKIKIWITTFNILSLNYEYIYYNSKSANVYCYINLNKIFFSLLTFFVFVFFWFFNICIFLQDILLFLKYIISILFFINLFKLLILLIRGIYEKFFDFNDALFDKALAVILKYINFLINISLIYYIFNLNIDLLLQYNYIYILNFFYTQCMYVLYKIKPNRKRIKNMQNFISYPYLSIFLMFLFLFINQNFSYVICVYFTDYIYLFDQPIFLDIKDEEKFKEYFFTLFFF